MPVKKAAKKPSKPVATSAEVEELSGDAEGKRRSIDLAIKYIKTKYGDESIMTYGNIPMGKSSAVHA